MEHTSRYAICSVGEGFSVEDRRTGERISYHRTWALATAKAKQLSRLYKTAVSTLDDIKDLNVKC